MPTAADLIHPPNGVAKVFRRGFASRWYEAVATANANPD
jgi:hypothetical protein